MTEKCMLCERATETEIQDANCIFEPKYDGTRILAYRKNNKVKLLNRRGNDKTATFPEIVRDLESMPVRDFIFDGEIIAADGKFNSLAKRDHLIDEFKILLREKQIPCEYMIFDVLFFNGETLINKSLLERKKLLKEVLPEKIYRHLKFVHDFPFEYLYSEARKGKLEGIVAKNIDSKYEFARSKNWKKWRLEGTEDMEVLGFEYSDAIERPIRSLICRDAGGEEVGVSGLDTKEMLSVRKSFENAPHKVHGKSLYLEGNRKLYIEVVRYKDSMTGTRFPRFKRFKI